MWITELPDRQRDELIDAAVNAAIEDLTPESTVEMSRKLWSMARGRGMEFLGEHVIYMTANSVVMIALCASRGRRAEAANHLYWMTYQINRFELDTRISNTAAAKDAFGFLLKQTSGQTAETLRYADSLDFVGSWEDAVRAVALLKAS